MRGTPVAIEITPQGAVIYLPETKERTTVNIVLGKTLEYLLGEVVRIRTLEAVAHTHTSFEITRGVVARTKSQVKRLGKAVRRSGK